MSSKFELIVKDFSAKSYEIEKENALKNKEENFDYIELKEEELALLTKKISQLPIRISNLFYASYVFNFSFKDTETLYSTSDAQKELLYYKAMLCSLLGIQKSSKISEQSFKKASEIAVELSEQAVEKKLKEIKRARILYFAKSTIKTTCSIAIVATIAFIIAFTASADFREAIISLFIEDHDIYSIVGVKTQEEGVLAEYRFDYIPQGYVLKNKVIDATFCSYTWKNDEGLFVHIYIVVSNQHVFYNTENKSSKNITINDTVGVLYEEDGFSDILFELNDNFIAVNGEAGPEELYKVAENIVTVLP